MASRWSIGTRRPRKSFLFFFFFYVDTLDEKPNWPQRISCYGNYLATNKLKTKQEWQECEKWSFLEPRTHHLHKESRMSAVPLDVAPERRTKRCSPRFRPGGRLFQIPVTRQWGREMSAPRPYVTDPFHPLGSISKNKSFLYIYQSVTSYLFHVVRKSVSLYGRYLTITLVLLETSSTEPWMRSIIQVLLTSFLYVLGLIDTKCTASSHVHT